ncbi:MAG: hypothetical protein IJB76_03590 [Clostridia bacterium]|nr:hypothetical protein [Clostridia bacterium]
MRLKTFDYNGNKVLSTKRLLVLMLAITVVLGVFWWLKLIGITMADEAFCGMDEHTHNEACLAEGCEKEEHTHIASCYSNLEADLETQVDWDASVSGVKLSGVLADDIVAIATTQLGYTESELNFILDAEGNRQGYNRYGAWHGSPYGDWSALFASFCLYYSDITEIMVPYNSGVDAMRLEWEKDGLYTEYDGAAPGKGDLVFFDKDKNGKADAVAVVKSVEDRGFTVIEGDVDNAVAEISYSVDDSVMGYGLITQVERKTVSADELERIDFVIDAIDKLPTCDEAWEEMALLEDDMDAFEKRLVEIMEAYRIPDLIYYEIPENLRHLVTNYSKLTELMAGVSVPSTYVIPVDETGRYTMYDVNELAWVGWRYGMVIKGKSVGAFLDAMYASSGETWINQLDYSSWYCYRIEYNYTTGIHYVHSVHKDGSSKRSIANTDANGYILLVHPLFTDASGRTMGVTIDPDVKRGDSVISYNASGTPTVVPTWASATQSTATTPVSGGVGYLLFGTYAKESIVDNSKFIHGGITTPNTTSFIDINLFDYGGSLSGEHINTLWQQDQASGTAYPRPGFQRPATITPSEFNYERYDFGFGDMIVSNFDMTQFNVAGSDGNPQGINKLYPGFPAIKATEGAMYPLLKNGSPALINGTDLGYLFKNGRETGLSYIEQKNSQNITGLFQYDAEKQLYYFDSRETHAQWNSSTNRFDLYDEEITPNFIMYPFGNFMPFTNLATDTTPLSPQKYTNADGTTSTSNYVNLNYIKRTVASAYALYNTTGLACYKNLADVMEKMYTNLTGSSSFLSGYESAGVLPYQLLKYYSDKVTSTTDASYQLYEKTVAKNGFDNMFSIDFDEESNFFFGMDIHFDFAQPKGGVVGADKDDMTFNFTGDDDVWVYLDGVLFLDLSGIHSHVGGTINFKEGKVYYYKLLDFTGEIDPTPYKVVTFAEILTAAGMSTNSLVNGTFAEDTVHSLDFYYMERGSGSSMCSINFNLTAMPKNSIEISKEVQAGTVVGDPYYLFQIVEHVDGISDTDNNINLIEPGTEYAVYDKVTLQFIESRTVDANGIIRIKANEVAMGGVPLDKEFFVRELVDKKYASQYSAVTIEIEPNPPSSNVNEDIVVGGVHYYAIESDHIHANSGAEEAMHINVAASTNGGLYALGSQAVPNTSDYGEANGYTAHTIDHAGKLNDGVISTNGTSNVMEVTTSGFDPLSTGSFNIYFVLPEAAEVGEVNVYSTVRKRYYGGFPDRIEVYVGYVKSHTQCTLLGSVTKNQHVQIESTANVRKYAITGTPVIGNIVVVKVYVDSIVVGDYNVPGSGGGVVGLTEVQIFKRTIDERQTIQTVDVTNVVNENYYSSLEIHKELDDFNNAVRNFTFDLKFDGVPVPVGTPYELYNADGTLVSGTHTVTTAGKVTFSSDKYVKFNNILADTKIELNEVTSTTYKTAYSFSCANNNPGTYTVWDGSLSQTLSTNGGVVVGNAALSTKHVVTVTNSVDPIELTVNGNKTLLNSDGADHDYTVKLTQVSLVDGAYVPVDGGVVMSQTVTVNGTAAAPVSFTLSFNSSWDTSASAYFLINEEGADIYPGYDTDYYILKVDFSVDSSTGKTTATPTLLLNGTGSGVSTFSFENALVGVLSISKEVEGIENTSGIFEFTVTVYNGTDPLNGTFACTDTKGELSSLTFTNGKAVINLSHGQTVQINNLPLGSTWTVSEKAADGYHTAYQVVGGEAKSSGLVATGEVTNASGVTFYNVGGYELPATNGSLVRHIMPYIGVTIMLLAFGIACIIRYKQKTRRV